MPAARKLGKRAAAVEKRYSVANRQVGAQIAASLGRASIAGHRNGVAVVVGMVVRHTKQECLGAALFWLDLSRRPC